MTCSPDCRNGNSQACEDCPRPQILADLDAGRPVKIDRRPAVNLELPGIEKPLPQPRPHWQETEDE